MMLKGRYIIIVVLLLVAISGCHNRTKSNLDEQDSTDSVDMVMDCDTIGDADDGIVHARMSYFDFDKVKDLTSFFDSISAKHPFPIWTPEEDDTNERVKRCIARIEAYRKGEIRFFPDSLVSSCIRSVGFNAAIANNHGMGNTDMVYGEWFMMCAAYYSPDITCLVEMQTPDHRAGALNYGKAYNDAPWWAYIFLKRRKGYEVRCLGDFVAVRSIFQLEDGQNRKYYLCSDNNSAVEFRQWLYWTKEKDDVVRVAECAEAPATDDEFTEYYFDKNRKTWKFAKRDMATGRLMATSDKLALSLVLDGEKSRFVK